MPRKLDHCEDWHVEVYPKDYTYGFPILHDDKDYEDACKKIVEQVRRHVDDTISVQIECKRKHVCGFCGSNWTEDSPDYNGGCCDEDEANNPTKESENEATQG